MTLEKAFVLARGVDYFQIVIPKGTIYKQQSSNNDWFTPTIIEDKIPILM